jgi:GDPmannose 4,6-dehydratase
VTGAMQQPTPGDYVVATGETHSVREFAEMAFSHVGLDYRDYIKINSQLIRPAEVELLQGDATLAKRALGWKSTLSLRDLVHEMVDEDLRILGDKRVANAASERNIAK